MEIRRAASGDIPAIDELLHQVLDVHQKGRPDLFLAGSKKYTDEELLTLLSDDERPVFVATDESGQVRGYVFCIHQYTRGDNILADSHALYIDDLCVDESARGRHIGEALYRYALDYARACGCDRLTLNVWSCNVSAMGFYQKMGLVPFKVGMEQVL